MPAVLVSVGGARALHGPRTTPLPREIPEPDPRARAKQTVRKKYDLAFLDLKFERRERDNVRGGHTWVIMDESSHLAHNACVTLFEDMFQPQEHYSRRTQTPH